MSASLERIARAHAAAAPRLRGGPAWAARRQAALERLLAHGLPTRRDDSWKYFNGRVLEKREFSAAQSVPPAAADLARLALPGLPERLVIVDGHYVPSLSLPGASAGLMVESLGASLDRDPAAAAVLLRSPGDDADDRYALLAEAFVDDGLVLRVAPGADVPQTLVLQHVTTASGSATSHTRIIVELGTGARLRLVEQFVTLGEAPTFGNLATELRIGANASLEHIRVHESGPAAAQVETIQVTQAADSRYRHRLFMLSGQLTRTGLKVLLDGPGAEAEVHGLFMVDGSRQVDLYTRIEHRQPHTRSEELLRGVAAGTGHGAFNGHIVVHPGAAKTDSQQSSRNLILSPAAEIDVRPQLEIYADDVKCSHGATTGSLDPAQLFYLLSRGLAPATARGLLTFAFCEDVVARVGLPEVRRHLETLVVGQLPDRDIIREFL